MEEMERAIRGLNATAEDLVCFCHLRWDFVYQRPQHLMSRMAKNFRVFFVEEPIFQDEADQLDVKLSEEKVWIVTPVLQHNTGGDSSVHTRQKLLLNDFFRKQKIEKFIAWYYTPMALKFTSHLQPAITIYDCMDELSAFKFAPVELKLLEAELFKKANLVFTGGHSLYEAKKYAHKNIYPFPSSIDKQHFAKARKPITDPVDQQSISGLRLGFYGVIDERFNIKMMGEVAQKRPDWQLIFIGPVVKISDADLPQRNNIHYLGNKSYKELPQYLAGWDFSLIPFEKNESTKYISPTKTPEYLAAGKPVISSSITDVVTPYADKHLVYIADTADELIACAEKELQKTAEQYQQWLLEVDAFLADVSWDHTAAKMLTHILALRVETSSTTAAEGLKSVA